MTVRLTNLRLPIHEPDAALPGHLARSLGVGPADIASWRIVRKSLDLRDKHDLSFVVSADVELADEATVLAQAMPTAPVQIVQHAEPPFAMPLPGSVPLRHPPVIIGSGPGGLAAAYFLAEAGYRPLVLERGTPVNERIRDVRRFDEGGRFEPESNYLFGEGGAGTFSDGKLTCRGTGPDVMRILELFAECKGKPSILYEHRPHLGSNRLPAVVKALRQRIEAMGGEVRFHCRVEDLIIVDGQVQGVATSSGKIPTEIVILAIGHSARDTFEMLQRRGVPLERKPFQFGVRIEHPQDLVNRVQYGNTRAEDRLGNADYSLIAHAKPDVFTFCMCAGGYVIPSVSAEGYFCTNGMSLSRRDSPYANSGLVVTVPLEHFGGSDPLAGIRLQERYERLAFELGRGEYRCPVQTASAFAAGNVGPTVTKHSYPRDTVTVDLREVLPPFIGQAVRRALRLLDRRWQGRFVASATVVGPEARGSSPVRIVRDPDSRESLGVRGLYPVGEGAGYAGGIVSAAVDGLRSAKVVVARHAPLDREKVS